MKLPKAYEAANYESNIYALWEKSGVFTADPASAKEHFSISMPPPNETGTLHVGHALFLTLQDIMARHARQQGKDVLWLPGTDHAALPVNALMEKQLAEQGTNKHEIGREEFLRRTREFVGDSRNTITAQIRAIGSSCDWSRLRYTLDETLNRTVSEVFVKMYKDGLIYRGHRIVNWDPNLETTVSDDEVDHREEKATFYTLKYGPFRISTARPETKFGDKYVVMHPDDKRYARYKAGETFECEWINGKVTATIVKDEAVDPEFGTGVMTITPWHDRTDFEIAERHGLEREQIIDHKGKLLPIAGEFTGMDIAEARPKIVKKLEEKGLLVGVDENYTHNLALNSRGKGVIEPQIMLQWFVDVNRPTMEWKGQMRSLKEVMRAVVEDGDIDIIPKRFEKIYYHWIDNLRDWCVSRQIWWGHQIPVWYKETGDGAEGMGDTKEIYVGVQAPEGQGWQQDPDTLDTWFSSALWTWSTLIDPELAKDYSLSLDEILDKSIDYQTYHPTSVMETGWDILFFWVARMILATTYVTGQVPFKTVYLHGLVRTESGKKMSKSDPETIVDPMEVIPQYGTDALRLALVSGTGAGNDQRLGLSKIVANRNFCNKLWNIARYIEDVVGEGNREEAAPKSVADHWILNMLSISTDRIGQDLANFRFSEAYDTLYHFVWDDFADWYIEASKVKPNVPMLTYVLEQTLKIAHPFAPFVSEAIWSELGWHGDEMLISKPWPKINDFDKAEADRFEELKLIISEARWLKTLSGTRADTLYHQPDPDMTSNASLIAKLTGLKKVAELPTGYSGGLRLTSVNLDLRLDVDAAEAKDNLENKLEKAKAEESTLRARLENAEYIEKAPRELVGQTEKALAEAAEKSSQLEKILQNL
jgi:valyl-tRNA synthetase